MLNNFPELTDVICQGIQRRLHTGVQCYVSYQGQTVLDDVISDGNADFNADDLMLWRSAAKPILAFAILLLMDESDFDLHTELGQLWDHCPEQSQQVTVSQILSHATGWPALEVSPTEPRAQILDRLLSTSRGEEVAYQPRATWELLAEIIEQKTGGAWFDFVNARLLQPLGLDTTFCGFSPSQISRWHSKIVDVKQREAGQLKLTDLSNPTRLALQSPGADFRGPISDLGKFYKCLLTQNSMIASQNVFLRLTTGTRLGQFDQTLQDQIDFGHGVILNRQFSTPFAYGFGDGASANAFGHGGAQCSLAFCDPDHQLVVAWAADALCGEGQHQRRNHAINSAIYRDLKIT